MAVTQLEPSEAGHSFPQFLPDGRHFLYYVRGSPDIRGVYVGQLDGSGSRRLLDADSGAVYASSGHLLFLRHGTLFAYTFNADRLELSGNPFPVAEQMATNGGPSPPALTVSAAGPVAYRTGPSAEVRQFVWFDRSGTEMGKVGGPGGWFMGPSLSPDGRRVALFEAGANVDVWLLDVGRGGLSRFTSDPADDVWPVWSPDGKSIVFSSTRNNGLDLFRKPTGEAGNEQLLLITSSLTVANDWSRDGRFLLYTSFDRKALMSLWALSLDGERKPFKMVQSDFSTGWGQFSPDGKWIAYASIESGRWEIYVQSFPGPGPTSLVSTGGGVMPRWRGDGKELFYIGLDDRLTAVPIRLASDVQAAETGTPVPLFTTRVGGALQHTDINPHYVVAPDGQRFLMNTVVEDASTSPITVILNWKAKP